MRESTILALVRRAVCRDGRCVVTRNTVGAGWIVDKRSGRESFLRWGLGNGSPDLVGVVAKGPFKGRCMTIETKTEEGRLSPAQKAWRRAARARGIFYAVARTEEAGLAAADRAYRGELE